MSTLRERLESRLRHLPPARRLRFMLALRSLSSLGGAPIRVLDAGAGDGLLSLAIAERHPAWTVVAADVREDALERGRSDADRGGLKNISFEQLDLTRPIPQGGYDVVLAMECLVEIPDDEAATAVFAEALRPGGLLLVHVPERDWRPVLRSSEATWKDEVRHGYTREELVGLLERHGLHVVKRHADDARDRETGARGARPHQDCAAGSSGAGVSAADARVVARADRDHLGPGPRALRGGAKAGVRRFLVPEADGPVEPSAPPSFSVLIRTYQNADTVVEAVESALNQTLPPFEIVVYDDGSTDGTDDVLRLYGDRIHYLRRENAGAAEAFNRGLEAARGDFVVVLDADDAFEPERIEALSELATARPDLDIVTTDAAWESEGRVVGRFNSEANPFEVENQRAAILERCFIVAPGVRRSAVLGVGGQDTRLEVSADWDCWIRMILGGSKAGSVDEPLLRLPPATREASARTGSGRSNTVSTCSNISGRIEALRDDDLAALDAGARAPQAGRSRSPEPSTLPTVATATRGSWRSPSSATSRTGARQG